MINILTKISLRRLFFAPSRKSVDKVGKNPQKELRIDIGDKILVNLNDEIITLQLVEDQISVILDEQVSLFTPLGSALMGRKINDEFEIIMSRGQLIRCKILDIL